MSDAIDTLMQQGVDEGVFPGAVLLAARGAQVIHNQAYGWAQKVPHERPMTQDTVFDIASLTKPIVTVTLIMLLKHEGRLSLGHPAARYLPDFAEAHKEQVTLRHLLKHTSGLPAWKAYYKELLAENPSLAVNGLAQEKLLYAIYNDGLDYPPGYQRNYSDLGYIILGAILEKVSGKSVAELFTDRIAVPLGLEQTSFLKVPRDISETEKDRFAATSFCPWRKRILCGEVEDDHAWLMGGAAGHAGLFGTATELHRFLAHLLTAYEQGTELFPQSLIHEFVGPKAKYKLGWDSPQSKGSQAGRGFSPHTIGHLGYTGCSLWLDLTQKFHVILLTNRTHPSRDNETIKEFRPKIHDLVVETYFKTA